LVIRQASVPGKAFSAANQPGAAYGSGAIVVVGATDDDEMSLAISIVVVGDSLLFGDDVLLASPVPHAVIARAQPVIIAMNDRANFIRISTIGVEE
jgi:hypothetical protein